MTAFDHRPLASSSAGPSQSTEKKAKTSLRETKKVRTRRALCDAAMNIVITDGYPAATIEAIAERAGVSVRTFHNYFPTKDAVFTFPFAESCERLLVHLKEQPDSLSLFDALSAAWLTSFAEQRNTVVQLALVVSAIAEVPSIRAHVADGTLSATAPVLAELARRDGNKPDSDMTAALTLRIIIEATGLAFASNPMRVCATSLDGDTLMRNENLLDDVKRALSTLRSLVAPPSPAGTP